MLLRDLLARVDGFDIATVQPIEDPVKETDTIVGKLPPELIKFYGVVAEECQALVDLGKRLKLEIQKLGKEMTDARREQFNAEYQCACDRYRVFADLFQVEVESEFPQIAVHAEAMMRSGFNVVVSDESDCGCQACRDEARAIVPRILANLIFGGR